jgi:TorA maturation chaperone TorD
LDRNILALYTENRSRFYSFLSELYLLKPDEDFLEKLTSKISEINQSVDGVLVKSIRNLRDTLKSSDFKELAQRLTIEFTRLLRGIKRGYGPPPPYESLYKGENRVRGEVTRDVMRMYQKAGFGIIDKNAGPQDYIGVELKFMSFLCHKEMEAWKKDNVVEAKSCLELEKEFLKRHLLHMVSRFSKDVTIEAKEKFYIAVAKLTEKFTITDDENINFLLNNVIDNGDVEKS